MNCEIPVPDPSHSAQGISADGSVVPINTPGAFKPPAKPLKGEEIKAVLEGRKANYDGASRDATKAYNHYISRLQQGTSGFTCFASLQMPRQ